MVKNSKRQGSKRKPKLPKHVYNMSCLDSTGYQPRKQRGGFLSRYDFAYAGRDTVNQAAKHVKTIAPGLINQTFNRVDELAPELVHTATRELDMVAARRINQIARRSGETIQSIAPGIIRGAIEELYKTPFRLLGQFGRRKYKQLKSRVYKRLRIKR